MNTEINSKKIIIILLTLIIRPFLKKMKKLYYLIPYFFIELREIQKIEIKFLIKFNLL